MARFIVSTDVTTTEQDSTFLQLLKAKWPHLGWWHNLTESWLLIDLSNTVTAEMLRDVANEAFPGIHKMVIAIESGNWAAFGRVGDFEWMHNQWRKTD
jgi:hypothetical protein